MKTVKITIFLLLLSGLFSLIPGQVFSCDMVAMMARQGFTLADLMADAPDTFGYKDTVYDNDDLDYIDPFEYFVFLGRRSRSASNNDGYGITYYKTNKPLLPKNHNQEFYLTGSRKYYKVYPETMPHPSRYPMHAAYEAVKNPQNRASILLGHDRNASGTTIGSHPFRFELDDDGDNHPDRTCIFQHNGSVNAISDTLKGFLLEQDPEWFEKHPLNWTHLYDDPDTVNPNIVIDSELLFHFIMYHVQEADGDIISGILSAVNNYRFTELFQGFRPTHTINFILSDGEGLYLFRNYPVVGSSHNLEYRVFSSGFVGVKTMDENDFYYPDVPQHSIVYIPRDETQYALPYAYDGVATFPDVFDNFETRYVRGKISEDTVWDEGDYFIIDDLQILEDVRLTINPATNVYFTGNHEFNVKGQLYLNGGTLNLSHGALVTVEGPDAEFFIDWGSEIIGSTPQRQKIVTKPGMPAIARVVKGDRIIVRHGAKITTPEDFDEPERQIKIVSFNDRLWEGIKITEADDSYWFTNCDISGIDQISILREDNNDPAKLNFYRSNFHNGGSIIAWQGAILNIMGCRIYENIKTPILAMESQIIIDAAEDSLTYIYNNHGYGVSLKYPSPQPSSIINAYFYQNTNGLQVNNHWVNIDNSSFISNKLNGIVGEGLSEIQLQYSTLANNGGAEYISYAQSYNMINGRNIIIDEIYNENSVFLDQYLLISIDHPMLPIDVSGNTIDTDDPERFYPNFESFYFGTIQRDPQLTNLYNEAMEDMTNVNYELALSRFETIIEYYPNTLEAQQALKSLYFLENQTDKDFVSLRDYCDEIQEYSPTLQKIAENVKILSFISEGDYYNATHLLNNRIDKIQKEEQVLAQLDREYCQFRVSLENPSKTSHEAPEKFNNYLVNIAKLESELFYNTPLSKQVAGMQEKPKSVYHYDDTNFSNYPNPFNPTTTLSFNLQNDCNVQLTIYNTAGQLVKVIVNDNLSKGSYNFTWKGLDQFGKDAPSGVYFCRLLTGDDLLTQKMLLLR